MLPKRNQHTSCTHCLVAGFGGGSDRKTSSAAEQVTIDPKHGKRAFVLTQTNKTLAHDQSIGHHDFCTPAGVARKRLACIPNILEQRTAVALNTRIFEVVASVHRPLSPIRGVQLTEPSHPTATLPLLSFLGPMLPSGTAAWATALLTQVRRHQGGQVVHASHATAGGGGKLKPQQATAAPRPRPHFWYQSSRESASDTCRAGPDLAHASLIRKHTFINMGFSFFGCPCNKCIYIHIHIHVRTDNRCVYIYTHIIPWLNSDLGLRALDSCQTLPTCPSKSSRRDLAASASAAARLPCNGDCPQAYVAVSASWGVLFWGPYM